jgi:hypothetical protein
VQKIFGHEFHIPKQGKNVDSKGLWRWCITLRTTEFLDFVRRLVHIIEFIVQLCTVKCEWVDWYIVVFDRKTKLIYIVLIHNRMHSLKIKEDFQLLQRDG